MMGTVMLTLWLYVAVWGHFLSKFSIYYLKLWHGSVGMIHDWKKKSFLLWQEWCDQEGETMKTKCLAVFEKWLTTEDQSSWQPKCSHPCWLFASLLMHSLTFSTSLSAAEHHEITSLGLCGSICVWSSLWLSHILVYAIYHFNWAMSHESLFYCSLKTAEVELDTT